MSEQIDYDAVSFVVLSKYRDEVFAALEEKPQRPSDISGDDLPMSPVSRALQELRERGLVELLVSEDVRKGRFYGLTDRGQRIADDLETFLDGDTQ